MTPPRPRVPTRVPRASAPPPTTRVRQRADTRAKAEASGIRLTTLAGWDAEDKVGRLYELDSITRQDIPSTVPILKESFQDFERRMEGPDRRPDRTWIALEAGRPIAMSYL